MTKFRFLILCGLFLTLLASSQRALAHADLVDAIPHPGDTIGDELTQMELVFSEAVGGNGRYLIVNSAFESVAEGELTPGSDAMRLVAPMPPLRGGLYTLQWTVAAEDGHDMQGAYQFSVEDNPFPWAIVYAAVLLLIAALAFVLVWRRVRPFSR